MSRESSLIHITNITEEDAEKVYEFALEYFLKDEPLNQSLGLPHSDGFKEFVTSGISDHCSFKAVDDNGVIIGIVLNCLTKRPISDNKKEVPSDSANEKSRKIIHLLDYCDQQWNIFDLYPKADIIFDCKIIAVHTKFRGLRIGTQLMQKCRDYMCQNNIPALRVVCTGHFSARIMEKLGMKEVHKLVYDDFKVNGEVYVKPEPPHVACRSFVMEI